MDNKKKLIMVSAAVAAGAGLLAVGGTYALFTTGDSVKVNVHSAQVALALSIDSTSLKTFSMDVAQTAGQFANGGTATIDGTAINVSNMAPGDKLQFNVKFANNSTIATKYVFSAAVKGDLSGILTVTESTPVTDWTNLAVGGTIADETVTVEMPTTAGLAAENKDAVISATAKVYQQNADTSAYIVNATQLKNLIANGGEGTLMNNIKVADADLVSASLGTVASGKTVELDLNGYCINTIATTNNVQALITNNGTLDIYDNSFNYDGVISLQTAHVSDWSQRNAVIVNNGAFTLNGGYLLNFTGDVDSDGNADCFSMGIDQFVISTAASCSVTSGVIKANYLGIRLFGGGATAALTSSLVLDSEATVMGGQRGIWMQNTGDWTTKPDQFESLTMKNQYASYGYAAPYVYGHQVGLYADNHSANATYTMTLTAGTIENAYAWTDNAYQAALSYNINGTAVTKEAAFVLKTITGGAKEVHSDHSSGSYVNTKIA